MQPIVVYDTNILLSSIGWGGNPYRCLALARQSKIEGLTCPKILDELAEKLTTKLNRKKNNGDRIFTGTTCGLKVRFFCEGSGC